MAPHSSTLAWKIPWTEEPGRLQTMGLLRVQHVDFTFTFHFHALEKEMATHSSVLAWRIPGTGEPGGLPSMGSHRVGRTQLKRLSSSSSSSSSFPLTLTQVMFLSALTDLLNLHTLPYLLACSSSISPWQSGSIAPAL